MQPTDLALLRRKELTGTVAWIGWLVWLAVQPFARPIFPPAPAQAIADVAVAIGWLFAAAWVLLDERSRKGRWSLWTILVLLTGPVGVALYYLTRQPAPSICLRCGSTTPGAASPCPACGHSSVLASVRSSLAEVHSGLANSLIRGPVERTKETTKHLAFAFAAVVVLGAILAPAFYRNPLAAIWGVVIVLSVAAYWVLVAWWVYLDSAWRRMDGVTWAILTLVTNLVGLVTYLVIRGPDPRTCPRCGAAVPSNLKYCPFCGSQAQATCPRCQAAIKPEWQYCSACAAPLRARQPTAATSPTPAEPGVLPTSVSDRSGVVIQGNITDAVTRIPISGARVMIDSANDGPSTTTDTLGRFLLPVDTERPYVLVASADGYVSVPKAYMPGTEEAKHILFALRESM